MRIGLITLLDYYAMGPRYIHSSLINNGFPCDLIMFKKYPPWRGFQTRVRTSYGLPTEREYDLLADLLKQRRYDVLGIGFRSFAFTRAERITRIARDAGVPLIVWGGNHPTLMPAECIAIADVVCVGEGENPMLDLVRSVDAGKPPDGIPNLWIRRGDDVQRNPIRPLLEDLDNLPFHDFSPESKFYIEDDRLENIDPYLQPGAPIDYQVAASRGCPYHCAFCNNSTYRDIHQGKGPWSRRRSPENVIRELEAAKAAFNLAGVSFVDEIFGSSLKWREELFALYREKVGLPFGCEVHPRVADENFADGMAKSGGGVIHIGVQSGSERVRREIYERPESDGEIMNAARVLHGHGITVWYDFIFNSPFDTPKDLAATTKLILDLPRPNNIKAFSLRYLPGTAITDRAIASGIIQPSQLDHLNVSRFLLTMALPVYAINRENFFHLTLVWMATLKLFSRRLELEFYSNDRTGVRHVFPVSVLRALARSRTLRRHPKPLYLFFLLVLFGSAFPLKIIRKARTLLQLIREGRFRLIGERLKIFGS